MICACKTIVTCAARSIISSRSKCWRLSARHTGRHTSRSCEIVCVLAGRPYCKSSRSMTLDLRAIGEDPTSSRNTSFPAACSRRLESSSAKFPKRGFNLSQASSLAIATRGVSEQWRLRFRKAWPKIEALGFDDRFKRTWEYYLAYCQAGFETEALNVGLYKVTRATSI